MPKGFQKGNTLGSSRKGIPNRKTQEWNNIGEALTTWGSERMITYLQTADDKEFADTFLKILEYFKPKQARKEVKLEAEVNHNVQEINYLKPNEDNS